jgi:hypothetical protein
MPLNRLRRIGLPRTFLLERASGCNAKVSGMAIRPFQERAYRIAYSA